MFFISIELMKINRLFFCILLWGILLFLSCKESQTIDSLLQEAKDLLNIYPDRALSLLEEQIPIDKFSSRQQAEWALFFTQAQDKLNITQTTDSIIRIAVNYYSRKNNPERLLLSYYYLARIYQISGDALHAQEFFLKAIQLERSVNDLVTKGRINANLANIYLFQDIHSKAIHYLNNAKYCFEELKDSLNLSIVLRDLARTYSSLNFLDSALVYYEQAIVFSDKKEIPFILNELSDCYIKLDEIEKAFEYVRSAISYVDDGMEYSPYPIYLNYGELYLKTGQLDSAWNYLHKSLESKNLSTIASAHYLLYQIAKESKDWNNYTYHQEKYENISNQIQEEAYSDALLNMQSYYDYQLEMGKIKRLILENNIEHNKNLILSLCFILLTLVFVILIVLYVYKKNKKEKYMKLYFDRFMEKKYLINSDQIIENRTRIEELTLVSNKMRNESIQIEINMLECINSFILQFVKERNEADVKLKNTKMYKSLHNGEIKKINLLYWNEICNIIDDIFPSLLSTMKDLNDKINHEDKEIAYLLKMELKPSHISQLIRITESGISMRQKRLAKKLFGKTGTTEQLHEFINAI